MHWANSSPDEDEWFSRDDLLEDFPEAVRGWLHWTRLDMTGRDWTRALCAAFYVAFLDDWDGMHTSA